MRENKLSAVEFTQLCEGAVVISPHIYGPKVLKQDDYYIKVFYPKKGWSSRHVYPSVNRFCKHTEQLLAHDITTVRVEKCYFYPEKSADIIVYRALPGTDFRENIAREGVSFLERLIPILIEQHQKGVYFRGLHLGNIVWQEHEKYGLIDVADCRFYHKPLSWRVRARHLRHLFKCKDDRAFYRDYGAKKFVEQYLEKTLLSPFEKWCFYFYVRKFF